MSAQPMTEAEHEAMGELPGLDAVLARLAKGLPRARSEERILLEAAAVLLRLVLRRLGGRAMR